MRLIVAFVTVVTVLLTAGSGGIAAAEVVDAGLLDAIKATDLAGVRAALGRGVDVAAADADGTTPLHWAVHANDATIVELLLAAGAEAQAANRHGVRPIALACTNGNAAIVELLLNAGVDGNATLAHGETALMTAARTGAPDVVELLLDHGADVNATETWRGQTALMWAAAEGHAELLPMLVSHGADIAARSTKGWTALLFAAREGHIDAVQTLLEAGADIEEALPVEPYERRAGTSAGRPSTGLNALLMATHNAHFELGALLVDRGADVNVALRGWTVLHQVSWVRKTSIPGGSNEAPPEGTGSMTGIDLVRKVVAAGADVNARVTDRPPVGSTRMNFIGGTPFLLAARTGDAELMRVLAELGADPLLPNEDNTTPISGCGGCRVSRPRAESRDRGRGARGAAGCAGARWRPGRSRRQRRDRHARRRVCASPELGEVSGAGRRPGRRLESAERPGLDAARYRRRRAKRHRRDKRVARRNDPPSHGSGGSPRSVPRAVVLTPRGTPRP